MIESEQSFELYTENHMKKIYRKPLRADKRDKRKKQDNPHIQMLLSLRIQAYVVTVRSRRHVSSYMEMVDRPGVLDGIVDVERIKRILAELDARKN